MLLYLFIFTMLSILVFSNKDKPKITLFVVVVFLIIMAGFRGNIDKDYFMYVGKYESIASGNYPLYEPLFILISYLVSCTVNNVVGLFLFFAFIGVGLKYLAIKKMSNFWVCSILVYFSYFFFLHDMTQIRTSVASAVLLLSIPFIYDKKFNFFVLLMFLGAMSHYSLVFVVPMYFINEKKVQNVYFFLIPLAYILFFLNINISYLLGVISSFYNVGETRFDYYLKGVKASSIDIFSVLHLIHITISYIFLWKWKFFLLKNKYFVVLIKFYIIGTFLYIAFGDIPALGIRFSELFQIVEIILIPMLIFLTKSKYDSKFFVIILSLFTLLLLTHRLELIKPYFN